MTHDTIPAASPSGRSHVDAGAAMRNAPVVELVGPWVANKGDAMMFEAVRRHFGRRVQLSSSPQFGLSEPGLLRVRWMTDYRREGAEALRRAAVAPALRAARNGAAMALLPERYVRRRGIVSGRTVSALLDCSGFAYGDQWSTRRLEARAAHYERLKRQGATLVLLPQALGPFERPEMRQAARQLFSSFDLLYARDATSFGHLERLGLPGVRIKSCPDITHLLAPTPIADREAWSGRACIVPNARMLDKVDAAVAARYVDLLVRAAVHLRSRGIEPVIIVHETNDDALVRELQSRLPEALAVYDEDAVTSKAYLGACRLAISSRYHAIVSTLSQETAVIGTSWTHKYAALFEEYGVPDLLAYPTDPDADITAKIDRLLDDTAADELRGRIALAAARNRAAVGAMWTEVDGALGLAHGNDDGATW